MIKLEDLQTPCLPTWCPGCGNFGIWGAFKNAAVEQGWDNTNTVLTAGIGCHSHILNFTKITSFEGLHGRAIPLATGIKLVNHKLNVFVFTGDGDCLGEGGNHFIHACRRNHDITILIHNNALYSLTTGQTSPTTSLGVKSKSTPEGNHDYPFNPLALALASGATFVARGFTGNMGQLKDLIVKANEHKGIAVVDILQPCTTLNKDLTIQFLQQNCYQLGPEHDVKNKEAAFKKSLEFGEKQIPLGIFYQTEKPSFESQLPQIKDVPLIKSPFGKNLGNLFKKYT